MSLLHTSGNAGARPHEKRRKPENTGSRRDAQCHLILIGCSPAEILTMAPDRPRIRSSMGSLWKLLLTDVTKHEVHRLAPLVVRSAAEFSGGTVEDYPRAGEAETPRGQASPFGSKRHKSPNQGIGNHGGEEFFFRAAASFTA